MEHDRVIKVSYDEFVRDFARGRGCKGIVINVGIFEISERRLLIFVARCLDERPSALVQEWEIGFRGVRARIWSVDVGVRGGQV